MAQMLDLILSLPVTLPWVFPLRRILYLQIFSHQLPLNLLYIFALFLAFVLNMLLPPLCLWLHVALE